MTKRQWLLLAAALLTAFAFGRWSAPEKIKIQKQIVEVEKKSTTKDTEAERNKRKEITVTEVIRPDGTKETTTHTVEETTAVKKKAESDSSESNRASNETKEVEKSSSKTTVSLMVGTNLQNPKIVYGGSAYRPILGPVGIGLWGLTDKTLGASVGLTF